MYVHVVQYFLLTKILAYFKNAIGVFVSKSKPDILALLSAHGNTSLALPDVQVSSACLFWFQNAWSIN